MIGFKKKLLKRSNSYSACLHASHRTWCYSLSLLAWAISLICSNVSKIHTAYTIYYISNSFSSRAYPKSWTGPWTLDSGRWTLDSGLFLPKLYSPPPKARSVRDFKQTTLFPPHPPPRKNLYVSPLKLPPPKKSPSPPPNKKLQLHRISD